MWLVGFLWTSLGIFIGGMIAWLFKGLQQRVDIINGLCAGIILGLISFELFPEAIELGGWLSTFSGLTIGMILFKVLHSRLHVNLDKNGATTKQWHIRTGLLLIMSFTVHNIPMGITLGANQESNLTMALLQALLFHSIPEGIILFMPLILAGLSVISVFFISLAVSIPVAFGVLIGEFGGFSYQSIHTSLIGLTIGIIFMVTVSEILHPAFNQSSIAKVVLWTFIGIGIMGGYLKLF